MIGLKEKSRKKIQEEEKARRKERGRRDKEDRSGRRKQRTGYFGRGLVEMPGLPLMGKT
jgi:hypothetical protein